MITLTPMDDGKDALRLNMHKGQERAWNSQARYVAVIAGTQSGKTSWGPWWLYREIVNKGPGDYMVVTPTFPLLALKALPAFQDLFEDRLQLGKYVGSPTKRFVFNKKTIALWAGDDRFPAWDDPKAKCTVFFGHAQDPDSLESATAKAAWLDEPGQGKFKLASWRAIQRRLRIHHGRVLFTTTPYNLGWLKQQVYDRAKHEEELGVPHDQREYEVINFSSIMNPMFDRAEYERARKEMPAWEFRMFYDGIFTRPAGLIYDCFDPSVHVVPPFEIPSGWCHHLGLDFGGVNTAGTFLANAKGGGDFYLYREYKAGGRTAEQHVEHLHDEGKWWSGNIVLNAWGGSKSEDQWRKEFRQGGLYVREPKVGSGDVEVGISRTYGAFKRRRLYVFADCEGVLEELGTYSRELDDNGQPTEKIENKEQYHYLDSLRYVAPNVIGRKAPPISAEGAGASAPGGGSVASTPGMAYDTYGQSYEIAPPGG